MDRPEQGLVIPETHRRPESVRELVEASGLTASQVGRLFGVTGRTIAHWVVQGGVPESFEARLAQVSLAVRDAGGRSPDETRARLLDSSGGPSVYRRLRDQVPDGAVLHAPLPIRELLGG